MLFNILFHRLAHLLWWLWLWTQSALYSATFICFGFGPYCRVPRACLSSSWLPSSILSKSCFVQSPVNCIHFLVIAFICLYLVYLVYYYIYRYSYEILSIFHMKFPLTKCFKDIEKYTMDVCTFIQWCVPSRPLEDGLELGWCTQFKTKFPRNTFVPEAPLTNCYFELWTSYCMQNSLCRHSKVQTLRCVSSANYCERTSTFYTLTVLAKKPITLPL